MNKSHWLSGSLIFVLEIAAFCTTIVHANIPIIEKNGKKYVRTGMTLEKPLGSKWLEIGMDNTQMAVDNKGVKEVWIWMSLRSFCLRQVSFSSRGV